VIEAAVEGEGPAEAAMLEAAVEGEASAEERMAEAAVECEASAEERTAEAAVEGEASAEERTAEAAVEGEGPAEEWTAEAAVECEAPAEAAMAKAEAAVHAEAAAPEAEAAVHAEAMAPEAAVEAHAPTEATSAKMPHVRAAKSSSTAHGRGAQRRARRGNHRGDYTNRNFANHCAHSISEHPSLWKSNRAVPIELQPCGTVARCSSFGTEVVARDAGIIGDDRVRWHDLRGHSVSSCRAR
jgi:hypothetical protein